MKQRVTYLLPEGSNIAPDEIKIEKDALIYTNAKDAALEKRVTVGLSELPDEVRALLFIYSSVHLYICTERCI